MLVSNRDKAALGNRTIYYNYKSVFCFPFSSPKLKKASIPHAHTGEYLFYILLGYTPTEYHTLVIMVMVKE